MHFNPLICKRIISIPNHICHESATHDTPHKAGSLRPRLKVCCSVEHFVIVILLALDQRLGQRLHFAAA